MERAFGQGCCCQSGNSTSWLLKAFPPMYGSLKAPPHGGVLRDALIKRFMIKVSCLILNFECWEDDPLYIGRARGKKKHSQPTYHHHHYHHHRHHHHPTLSTCRAFDAVGRGYLSQQCVFHSLQTGVIDGQLIMA